MFIVAGNNLANTLYYAAGLKLNRVNSHQGQMSLYFTEACMGKALNL